VGLKDTVFIIWTFITTLVKSVFIFLVLNVYLCCFIHNVYMNGRIICVYMDEGIGFYKSVRSRLNCCCLHTQCGHFIYKKHGIWTGISYFLLLFLVLKLFL